MTRPRPEFDRHADRYDAELDQGLRVSGESKLYFARGRIEWLRERLTRIGRPAPADVLDWGCGTGDATALLAEAFPRARVVGVDPSSQCIERARQHHACERISFVVLDEGGLAGVPRVDLIHVNGVLHHVPPAERSAFFAGLVSRLLPGGKLALFENNPLNPGTQLVMARIPFDRDAVKVQPWQARRLARQAGLVLEDTAFLFYFPHALRALRPLERGLRVLPFGAQYGVLASRP